MASLTHEQAHELARTKGVSKWLYRFMRLILVPFMRIWFGLRIIGAENIPATGPAVITPNHKSFFDSFFIAAATKRHIRFMGKSELFTGWHGRLLVALGAFPVKRGESDADALETSRQILAAGGLLALFPEGTRVRDPDALGVPKRGAARLAIEAHAPLIPSAITGTEKLFFFGIPKVRRVQIAFGEPISVAGRAATPEAAGALLGDELWPQITEEFHGLRARPGLVAAGLAAAGLGIALQHRRRRHR